MSVQAKLIREILRRALVQKMDIRYNRLSFPEIESEYRYLEEWLSYRTKHPIKIPTLKRMFRYGSYNFLNGDKRSRKTLDGLARALDLPRWEVFLEKNIFSFKTQLRGYDPVHETAAWELENLISKAKQLEFTAMLQLPTFSTSELKKCYYFEEDAELWLFTRFLEQKNYQGLTLDKHQSHYEIEFLELKEVWGHIFFVQTKENWKLVWKHAGSGYVMERAENAIKKSYIITMESYKYLINSELLYSIPESQTNEIFKQLKNWRI